MRVLCCASSKKKEKSNTLYKSDGDSTVGGNGGKLGSPREQLNNALELLQTLRRDFKLGLHKYTHRNIAEDLIGRSSLTFTLSIVQTSILLLFT